MGGADARCSWTAALVVRPATGGVAWPAKGMGRGRRSAGDCPHRMGGDGPGGAQAVPTGGGQGTEPATRADEW